MGFPNYNRDLQAPLQLPAEVGKPLTTQGGTTLDDGSGNMTTPASATGYFPTIEFGSIGNSHGGSVTIGRNFYFGPQFGMGNNSGQQQSADIMDWPNADGTTMFKVSHVGQVLVSSGATISSGTGAPTIAGTAGDFFFRTDTPTVADQRIYVCTVSGAAGAATWVGIV